MWLITVRDLQWRRRRFAFGVVGTALVFAVTLVLAGLTASLRDEARHTVAGVGADAFVVAAGVTGPFSGLSGLPPEAVATVAATPGVRRADPLVVAFSTVGRDLAADVTVFGFRPGGMGQPPVVAGRPVQGPGEAVVDETLRVRLGYRFTLGGRQLTAVGRVRHLTLRAGVPNVYVPITDAQEIFFRGNPIVNSVVTQGVPRAPIPGMSVLNAAAARRDVLRPFRQAMSAMAFLRGLLWLVAVAIVGTVIYLSVLERVPDFAVFKAIGTGTAALAASLALQAVVVSVTAAVVAVGLAHLLSPAFPLPISVTAAAALTLPVVAVGIGVLASLVGLRRAIGVDPAAAFGSA
jgi:putative ABC transport system permease protein